MQITVALDGEKKRDLRFFAGDDMSLTIVVYEHDGDTTPITVTNVRFAAADGELPMDSEFVVPSNFFGRVNYRIVGEVEDITTTLAYGVMQTEGGWPSLFCWCSGPGPYGIVGKADNITVLDANQNFDSPTSVEGALRELGDFKKSAGDISAAVADAEAAATEATAKAGEAAASAADAAAAAQTKVDEFAVDLAASGGAALVGFVQSGIGAVSRTLQSKDRDTVSVKDFGAVGNGIADDTAAIQAAFNASKFVYIPPGDYVIDAMDPGYPTTSYGGGVKPQNGSSIQFAKGARLVAKTNATAATAYVIMNLRGTVDVTIYDGAVLGDVDTHTGLTGEWGFGYYVASATNPRLMNCSALKCWGDGFYVGNSVETAGGPTSGGVLSNCVADDNRRQGLSIVSWTKGLVLGGEFKNTGLTKFTQPAYGIDIEPDNSGADRIDVTLVSVRTSGNHFGGLQIVPGFMSANAYTDRQFNVTVIGFESRQDAGQGALRFAYPDLAAPGMNVANKVNGSIRLSEVKIVESTGRGVDFARWVPTAPEVIIDGIDVIDCNTSGSTATLENQCSIVMFMDVANVALQTGHGKVTLRNPRMVDTRAVPKMLLPIAMSAGAGQSFSGISIHNPSGSGWSSGSNGFVRCTNSTGVSITFDNPPAKDFAGTIAMTNGSFAGERIALTASGVVSLPPANTSIGLTYVFENRYGPGVDIQVRPDGAATIRGLGLTAGNDVVLSDKADCLTVKCIDATTWEVVQSVGRCRPLSFLRPPTIVYLNAAPTTGTWLAGDIAISNAVARATPIERWKCSVGGTPGTWGAAAWATFSGTTAQRPTLMATGVGVTYLDTTLAAAGKPITWNGSAWVDATGAIA